MNEREWVEFSFERNGEGCLVCSAEEAAAFIAAGDLTPESRITAFYHAGRKVEVAGSLLGFLFAKPDEPRESQVPAVLSSTADDSAPSEEPESSPRPTSAAAKSPKTAKAMKAPASLKPAPLGTPAPAPQAPDVSSPAGPASPVIPPAAFFMALVIGLALLLALMMMLLRPPQDSAVLAEGGGDDVVTDSSSELLTFATSREVIGMNPAYLEQRLGVPKIAQGAYRVFEVGGCEINYFTGPEGITSFSLDINDQCHPTIDNMRIGENTTFGEIDNNLRGGIFYAYCLYLCGNAADPVLSLVFPGYRANGDIEVQYSSNYQQSASAMELWEKNIRREEGLSAFESPSDYRIFFCQTNPSSQVKQLMQRMSVRTVSMYYVDGSSRRSVLNC